MAGKKAKKNLSKKDLKKTKGGIIAVNVEGSHQDQHTLNIDVCRAEGVRIRCPEFDHRQVAADFRIENGRNIMANKKAKKSKTLGKKDPQEDQGRSSCPPSSGQHHRPEERQRRLHRPEGRRQPRQSELL